MLNPDATVKSLIPHGLYCYQYHGTERVMCPFWSKTPNQPEQEDGYCSFLGRGDWNIWPGEGMGLLWDQVKECGINDETLEEM